MSGLAASSRLNNFNPRSPCGERLRFRPATLGSGEFQSTLSLRRATETLPAAIQTVIISIHALLAESDGPQGVSVTNATVFQSTLSLRRATLRRLAAQAPEHPDFNPRSPCGERLEIRETDTPEQIFQSTLSLRRATSGDQRVLGIQGISIHALLAESDSSSSMRLVPSSLFQSTLSLRRATGADALYRGGNSNFNPRSPCGERPQAATAPVGYIYRFQSTLSLRRATSIRPSPEIQYADFNPRSPCGERLSITTLDGDPAGFQSTLSLRRATTTLHVSHGESQISIHALLAESDAPNFPGLTVVHDFNPRSPCGERRRGAGRGSP